MLKPYMLFLAGLLAVATASAQPQGINFQALVRDAAGSAVKSKAVSVRIRLHQDSAAASVAYAETHSVTTNNTGNINLVIGHGTPSGNFSALDWSHSMFLEIGVDVNGGGDYADLGTTQLQSVPYALFSARSAAVNNDADTDSTNEIQVISLNNDTLNLSKGGGHVVLPNHNTELADADHNTLVEVEKSTNENIIHFTLNGTEKMHLQGSTLGFLNTGGSVFIGDSAGFGDHLSNNQGAFLGTAAGASNYTGAGNSFLGYHAGYSNVSGGNNTFLGRGAGSADVSGGNNTFVGSGAGRNATGAGNVFLGYAAGQDEAGSNKLYIANSSTTTPLIAGDFAGNSLVVNGSMTVTGTLTSPSDRRLKENIEPLPDALGGVSKLNGVYYRYKRDSAGVYPRTRQIGVIAQDVEAVYPELVATTPNGFKAVDYAKLTAVLIEAVKELKRENAESALREKDLEKQIVEMQAQMAVMKDDSKLLGSSARR